MCLESLVFAYLIRALTICRVPGMRAFNLIIWKLGISVGQLRWMRAWSCLLRDQRSDPDMTLVRGAGLLPVARTRRQDRNPGNRGPATGEESPLPRRRLQGKVSGAILRDRFILPKGARASSFAIGAEWAHRKDQAARRSCRLGGRSLGRVKPRARLPKIWAAGLLKRSGKIAPSSFRAGSLSAASAIGPG